MKMSTRRRKPPVVSISEVKLRPRPPQRSCGSQTIPPKEVSSEEFGKEPPPPPPTPPLPEILNVTVKFYFNESSVVSRVYNNHMTLAEVKLDLAKRFEVEPELLILQQFDMELSNECCIYETIDDDLGIYNYHLSLSEEIRPNSMQWDDSEQHSTKDEDYFPINPNPPAVKMLNIDIYNKLV